MALNSYDLIVNLKHNRSITYQYNTNIAHYIVFMTGSMQQ